MLITFDGENHPEQDFFIEWDADYRYMQVSSASRHTPALAHTQLLPREQGS
jgi:hypothetical protein